MSASPDRPTFAELFPGMTRGQACFYVCARSLCGAILYGLYGLRRLHHERVPQAGAVVLVSNHQSHLDPPAIGVGARPRCFTYVARETLFKVPVFGAAIRAVNAIPIRRGEADTAAIRKFLDRLKIGSAVLAFPEGTRTPDGKIHEFKRGALLMIRKSGAPVVPVGLAGFYDAWPRTRKVPRLIRRSRVVVCYGRPITAEELMADGPDAALDRLKREITALHEEAAAHTR